LEKYPGGNDFFIVYIGVKPGNIIRVFVDRTEGITIKECAEISRFIQKSLNRDEEDFELMVSSPGLDRPLQVWEQYRKNIGRSLKIKLNDGSEYKGTLTGVDRKKIILEKKAKKNKKKDKNTNAEPSTIEIPFDKIDKAMIIITY